MVVETETVALETKKESPLFKRIRELELALDATISTLDEVERKAVVMAERLDKAVLELADVRAQLHTKSMDALVKQINRVHDLVWKHIDRHA